MIERAPCGFRIPYRQPFDWAAMSAFYAKRAVEGVEVVDGRSYSRSVAAGGIHGTMTVRHDPASSSLIVAVDPGVGPLVAAARDRAPHAFDIETDLDAVSKHLARDPHLAALVAAQPAVRIFGHWDPFETAMRAVLGQQVTVTAARRLAARLVERAGAVIGEAASGRPYRLFPTPGQVLAADLSAMGMPGARARTLQAVAEAVLRDDGLLRRGGSLEDTVSRLCAIKGVGPWTAQYVALRACREPDAFPASDVGLMRGMTRDGRRPTPAELLALAEAWRPFRAYAAHHIWASVEAGDAARGGRCRS